MAPSTATPSSLHRAPVACLKCRAAKVRCLVSQTPDRCHRCITNDFGCVFAQPKRAKTRVHPYPRAPQTPVTPEQHLSGGSPLDPSSSHDDGALGRPESASGEGTIHAQATDTQSPLAPVNCLGIQASQSQRQPLVTPEIRARIVKTLATLKGKRGAPFSFITSGDQPRDNSSSEQPVSGPEPPLKLASILRPLISSHQSAPSTTRVQMPTYSASVSLSQTVNDPIDSGMLSLQESTALIDHFMAEMNTKWEYLLDPRVDTHDDVRRRSRLLFATILFCSSKFAGCSSAGLSPSPDPYLLTRLCSLARSLVVSTFALGDRSIETMQAFYLLVCWKDPEDDISYIHSGYALHIMQELDLKQGTSDGRLMARRQRTSLALYRQDKQQSLFFVRRPNTAASVEPPPFLGEMDAWMQDPQALPFDNLGCCSADVRWVQSKLRALVYKSSATMLPCLLDVMESDLARWRTTWYHSSSRRARDEHAETLLCPGDAHRAALLGLWEHSVRLSIASMILRQVLVTTSRTASRGPYDPVPQHDRLDLPGIGEVSSPNAPGLRESIEGAFGTLQSLMAFAPADLRKAPDAVLLLGPNAALFLCLLLVFPCEGVLGVNFQRAATNLIRDVSQFYRECIRSPQDTINLHSAYLDSLRELIGHAHPGARHPDDQNMCQPAAQPDINLRHFGFDDAELQAAQDLAGMAGPGGMEGDDVGDFTFTHSQAFPNNMDPHAPDLADLLDTYFFWDKSAVGWV